MYTQTKTKRQDKVSGPVRRWLWCERIPEITQLENHRSFRSREYNKKEILPEPKRTEKRKGKFRILVEQFKVLLFITLP